MAWSFIRAETGGTSKTSGAANLNMTLAASVDSGTTILLAIVFDNLTTSTPTVSSIAKQTGETNDWVSLGFTNSPTSGAAGGLRCELWAIITTTSWAAADYTVTLSGAVTAKACKPILFTGGTTTLRGTATSSALNNPATYSINITSPQTDDLVIGLACAESSAVTLPTADTDTLNGSWSTAHTTGTTGGSASTNVDISMQHKIVTATGTQTFNGDGPGNDMVVLGLALQPAATAPQVDIDGALTVTATLDGAAQVDHPVDGDRSTTVTLSGALAVDRPVSGDLGVTAALAGAIDVVVPPVEISGNLGVTASATADVVAGKDVAGGLAATAGLFGTLAADRPVAGDLAVTAARTAALALTRPVDGNTTVTVATTAELGRVVDLSGNLVVTATRSGDVVTGKDISGNRAVTVGLTADIQTDRNLSGALAVTSSRTGELAITRTYSGDRPVVATLAASLTLEAPVAAASVVTAVLVAALSALPPYEPSRVAIDGAFGATGRLDGTSGATWTDERGGAGSGTA